MKKKLLGIFILLGVIALLVVGYFVLMTINPKEQPTDEDFEFGLSITDEGIRVYHFTKANVDRIEVQNEVDQYAVRMTEDENVVIVGYESVPLKTASASGLFSSVETLSLETLIAKDCENMAQFGLLQPQANVTIYSKNNASVSFCIGNHAPVGDYYYFCVSGEDDVYLIDSLRAERYLFSISQYCDTRIYKPYDSTADFRALKISSPIYPCYTFRETTDDEKENGLYYTGVTMTEPFSYAISSEKIEEIMTRFLALEGEVVAIRVSDADLALYGLDSDHRTTIRLSVNADPNPTMYNNTLYTYFDAKKETGVKKDFDIVYDLGETVNHKTYLRFDEKPVVYLVPDDVFSFLTWTPSDVVVPMLYADYIKKVSYVSVTSGSLNAKFELFDADSATAMTVVSGNDNIIVDDFRSFYHNLMDSVPQGNVKEEPKTTSLLKILIHQTDGTEYVLDFGKKDALECYATVNGETHFTVKKSYVDKMIRDASKLLKGETVNTL